MRSSSESLPFAHRLAGHGSELYRTCLAFGLFIALWCAPRPGHADDYVAVADKPVETIAANPFIAGAYGFIWVAVLVYVVNTARSLARTRAEVAELARKLRR